MVFMALAEDNECTCKLIGQLLITNIFPIQLLGKSHFLMKMDLMKTCQYARFAINLSTLLMLVGIDMLKTMYLSLDILEQAKAKGQHRWLILSHFLALLHFLKSHILLITLITRCLIRIQ